MPTSERQNRWTTTTSAKLISYVVIIHFSLKTSWLHHAPNWLISYWNSSHCNILNNNFAKANEIVTQFEFIASSWDSNNIFSDLWNIHQKATYSKATLIATNWNSVTNANSKSTSTLMSVWHIVAKKLSTLSQSESVFVVCINQSYKRLQVICNEWIKRHVRLLFDIEMVCFCV